MPQGVVAKKRIPTAEELRSHWIQRFPLHDGSQRGHYAETAMVHFGKETIVTTCGRWMNVEAVNGTLEVYDELDFQYRCMRCRNHHA